MKKKVKEYSADLKLKVVMEYIRGYACFYGHTKVWKELERRGFDIPYRKVTTIREKEGLKAVCPTYSNYRAKKRT
ncbi:MAG TPA: hypothetical protein DDW90_08325 [Cyanobacteria bacterium UBA9971]|nr:hypothetical protein [Cyanobacteria bacterium UBA9971]